MFLVGERGALFFFPCQSVIFYSLFCFWCELCIFWFAFCLRYVGVFFLVSAILGLCRESVAFYFFNFFEFL